MIAVQQPTDPVVRAVEDFDAFYRREYRSVVSLARVLSGRSAAAEELAQEAFTAAYRQWDRIARYEKPEAWVRRVVANRSVSLFRRTSAEARAILRMRVQPLLPDLSPETEEVWQAVRSLPRRQAQAIALQYLDDLPQVEIAEILGCSVETVRTHVKRARATLAERLQP